MDRRQSVGRKANRRLGATLLLASSVVLMALVAPAPGADTASAEAKDGLKWTDDLEAAKKQAAKEGKDILIDFTGSDWCPWCVRLVSEVFSKEEFYKEAPKRYVFVELDFPKDKSGQSKELQARNNALKDEYGVTGFPTIFLADAKGVPYAQTSYERGGPENYLKHMAGFRKKNAQTLELLAKAAGLSGLEKAKALDAAMGTVQGDLLFKYRAKDISQIIALDADDKGGLKSKYEKMKALSKALAAKDYKKTVELSKALLEGGKLTAEQTQNTYFDQGYAHFSLKNKDAALEALRKARGAAPDTPKAASITSTIERVFPNAAENKKAEGEETEKK